MDKKGIEESRSRTRIWLTGKLNDKLSPSFESYRLAVMMGVNGYIRIHIDNSLEIVAEAQDDVLESFIEELSFLNLSEDIKRDPARPFKQNNFTEFRIIHQ